MVFRKLLFSFEFLLLFTVAFFVVEVSYYVVFLDTWFDEANYTYKAWLAAKDILYPFIDFRVKYPPIGFYSQMLFQDIFGLTILGARVLSAILFSGVAFLTYQIGKKLGNKWIGLIALAMLTFHPYLVGHFVSAVPYALTVLFPLLSIWVYEYSSIQSKKVRGALAIVLMTCSVLTRYNMLPILVMFWLYVWFKERSFQSMLLSILVSTITFVVGMVPYLLIDAEYAGIWILYMFGPLASLFPIEYYQLLKSGTKILTTSYSEEYLKFLIIMFTKYFYIWIILGTALVVGLLTPKRKVLDFAHQHSVTVFFVFASLVLFLAHYSFFISALSAIHILYAAPFLILGVSGLLSAFWKTIDHVTWRKIKVPASIAIMVTIVFTPLSIAHTGPQVIFFNRFDKSDTDLTRVTRGGEYLKSLTTPEDKIFVFFDAPHIVAMAERDSIGPLINGDFTYVKSRNEALLERYRFYNVPMFLEYLENDATVFIMQQGRLETSNILTRHENKEYLQDFKEIIDEEYELIGSIENVYPRKYTLENGTMEVYRKRTEI